MRLAFFSLFICLVVVVSSKEHALVAVAKSGDEKAFALLVTPCRVKAWNVCLRICGNYHDANDALGAALALAWKNLAKFHGASAFSTWFYRIASNAAIELVRSRKMVDSIDEASDAGGVELRDFRADFDEAVVENDRLDRAMSTLSDQSREALVLWAVAGMKISEIAQHQGSSVSATKVRLHRAKKDLRVVLDAVG